MKIHIVSFTQNGAILQQAIMDKLINANHDLVCHAKYPVGEILPLDFKLEEFVRAAFLKSDAIIFISACAIAVRAVARHINTKLKDPAVLVIDEKGEFVIPILSGHFGGANKLAGDLSILINATPVITTATDINEKFAVDNFARENHLSIIEKDMIKEISARVLAGSKVGFYSDYELDCETARELSEDVKDLGIVISQDIDKSPFLLNLHLVPRFFSIGVGLRKGLSELDFKNSFYDFCRKNKINIYAIRYLATIDIKENEPALLSLAKEIGVKIKFFSATQLDLLQGEFSGSEFVKSVTGVDNVCERASIKSLPDGVLTTRKTIYNGATFAAAKCEFSLKF